MPNAWPAGSATTGPADGVMTSELAADRHRHGTAWQRRGGRAPASLVSGALARGALGKAGHAVPASAAVRRMNRTISRSLPPPSPQRRGSGCSIRALQNGVAVIACGHLHVYRRMEYRGIEIVWAPATSFFNILEKQHRGLGVPRAGYVEWTLEGRSIASSAGGAAADDHARRRRLERRQRLHHQAAAATIDPKVEARRPSVGRQHTAPNEASSGRKAHRLRQQAIALPAHGLVVGPGDDGHLLHVEPLGQLLDALGDLRAGADEGAVCAYSAMRAVSASV